MKWMGAGKRRENRVAPNSGVLLMIRVAPLLRSRRQEGADGRFGEGKVDLFY